MDIADSWTLEEIFHINSDGQGEGNGNPLQYSCLENPVDGGAWWAAVHGVAQSWTRLKRLSSSSSSSRWPRQSFSELNHFPALERKLPFPLYLTLQSLRFQKLTYIACLGEEKKKSYRSYLSVKISIVTSVRKREHLKFRFGID